MSTFGYAVLAFSRITSSGSPWGIAPVVLSIVFSFLIIFTFVGGLVVLLEYPIRFRLLWVRLGRIAREQRARAADPGHAAPGG